MSLLETRPVILSRLLDRDRDRDLEFDLKQERLGGEKYRSLECPLDRRLEYLLSGLLDKLLRR